VDVTEWRIRPYPLSETFFAERLRGCDYACSAEVYGRLREADIIDARGFSKWHKCENCWCAARAPARCAIREGNLAAPWKTNRPVQTGSRPWVWQGRVMTRKRLARRALCHDAL
jgi:hypothetical protein